MNDKTKSGAPRRGLGNIPFVILFASLAIVYALDRNWLDSATWTCMAVAMLLTHGVDLSQPSAWKKPRQLLGIVLFMAASAMLIARLVIAVVR